MIIAFCDEDNIRLSKMRELVRAYFGERENEAETLYFSSPQELVEKAKDIRFDIVFLNMRFGRYPGVHTKGLDVSREIRKYDPYVPFVFFHKSEEGVYETVFVQPKRYVNNLFEKRDFFPMMDSIYEEILSHPMKRIQIKDIHGELITISVDSMIFAKVTGRTIAVYLHNGTVVETAGPMKEFAEIISPFPNFISPHRSYIINSLFITHMTSDQISMRYTDKIIPIAKGKGDYVKDEYKKFLSKYWIMPYPEQIAQIDNL